MYKGIYALLKEAYKKEFTYKDLTIDKIKEAFYDMFKKEQDSLQGYVKNL